MTQQMDLEFKARDQALDALEEYRRRLVQAGRLQALALAQHYPHVTSVMVRDTMRANGWDVDSADPRWLGAVFRSGSGWRRVGWEATGSHGRPVARWVRA